MILLVSSSENYNPFIGIYMMKSGSLFSFVFAVLNADKSRKIYRMKNITK